MNIVKDFRRSRHLTQKQMGRLIGVCEQSVKFYESGRRPIPEVVRKVITYIKYLQEEGYNEKDLLDL